MKSLNTKIVLVALGFAVLATPALAARHRQPQDYGAAQSAPVEQHYPNGAEKTGSAANRDSGAEFNLGN
jgi:hypothetical protein